MQTIFIQVKAELGKRDGENDGLLDAGVNVDLIEAYNYFRIEKIDMLKLDKKHKKEGAEWMFHWVLEFEDDLFHMKEGQLWEGLVKKI